MHAVPGQLWKNCVSNASHYLEALILLATKVKKVQLNPHLTLEEQKSIDIVKKEELKISIK